ncbi:hypothetical protein [Actinoplanes sp. GCM10030250]|uniref:hypothetical protein n=1 Tax=Actinoplanes sp. GCM10030250 TaxID=3273376 RepID=UPI0036079D34
MTDRAALRIAVTGIDDEDTEEATIALGEVLAELPIDTMKRPAGAVAPPGTRATEALEVGAIVVALASSPEVISAVLGGLRQWVSDRRRGRVEVTVGSDVLILDNASPEQQDKIVDAFIERAFGR